MKNNYFIIHGSYGSPFRNWLPWLEKQIRKRDFYCTLPSFPTPYQQNYECWSKILKAYFDIGYINDSTTFITHSLGSVFLVKFLLENKIKVKKIITVAGFNDFILDDDMDLYKSFYIDKEKLKNIKQYTDEIISFYSDNDPVIPMEVAEKFADEIFSKKILIKNAWHFNEKYSFTEFEEILKYIF